MYKTTEYYGFNAFYIDIHLFNVIALIFTNFSLSIKMP
jgi:hypothetical protein